VARETEKVHRPVFGGIYQWCAAQAMEEGEAEFRRELLDGVAGRIIRRFRVSTSPLDRLASTQALGAPR
jgi:hypothetical protein